ncbi:MAG: AAA family ATPase [Thermodesulfobacteriota bacterium]
MKRDLANKSKILAVGGGKGGVGKSFILSSLGMSLAKKGKVVMIDGDLGGANLHNFLCVSRPQTSLTDFFEKKVPLSELVIDSGIENLSLISGMIGTTGAESIKHVQKKKFLTHVRNLDTDYIMIDLGAGTNFNTIDTLLLADQMMIVVIPEIPSIENMYNFLRNLFFRKIGTVLNDYGYRGLIVATWKMRQELGIVNFKQLVDYLKSTSPELRQIVEQELSSFTVNIVLNQVRRKQDIVIGNSVKSVCRKFFGINALYSGYVEHDESVSRCINKRLPYMNTFSTSRCARGIERLTDNLMTGNQVKIIH